MSRRRGTQHRRRQPRHQTTTSTHERAIPPAPPARSTERCKANVAAAVAVGDDSAMRRLGRQLAAQLDRDLGERRRGEISISWYSGDRRFSALAAIVQAGVDEIEATKLSAACSSNHAARLCIAASDAVPA
jgi:hypothetical protein